MRNTRWIKRHGKDQPPLLLAQESTRASAVALRMYFTEMTSGRRPREPTFSTRPLTATTNFRRRKRRDRPRRPRSRQASRLSRTRPVLSSKVRWQHHQYLAGRSATIPHPFSGCYSETEASRGVTRCSSTGASTSYRSCSSSVENRSARITVGAHVIESSHCCGGQGGETKGIVKVRHGDRRAYLHRDRGRKVHARDMPRGRHAGHADGLPMAGRAQRISASLARAGEAQADYLAVGGRSPTERRAVATAITAASPKAAEIGLIPCSRGRRRKCPFSPRRELDNIAIREHVGAFAHNGSGGLHDQTSRLYRDVATTHRGGKARKKGRFAGQ
jgi:hypothetical protein